MSEPMEKSARIIKSDLVVKKSDVPGAFAALRDFLETDSDGIEEEIREIMDKGKTFRQLLRYFSLDFRPSYMGVTGPCMHLHDFCIPPSISADPDFFGGDVDWRFAENALSTIAPFVYTDDPDTTVLACSDGSGFHRWVFYNGMMLSYPVRVQAHNLEDAELIDSNQLRLKLGALLERERVIKSSSEELPLLIGKLSDEEASRILEDRLRGKKVRLSRRDATALKVFHEAESTPYY